MNSPITSHFVVQLDQVVRSFNGSGRNIPIIKNVSLTALSGELTLLLGPSGSGKTTMLQIAAGLLAPTKGSATLFGKNIMSYRKREMQKIRATRIGFVFQTFRLIDSLTALQNITLALRFAGVTGRTACSLAIQKLEQFDIGHLADRRPGNFSQGEKQRVAIARALINSPTLVVADEPTACVESRQGQEIISILHQYAHDADACVLVASHDLRLVEKADRIYRLTDGSVCHVDGDRGEAISRSEQLTRG